MLLNRLILDTTASISGNQIVALGIIFHNMFAVSEMQGFCFKGKHMNETIWNYIIASIFL